MVIGDATSSEYDLAAFGARVANITELGVISRFGDLRQHPPANNYYHNELYNNANVLYTWFLF